MNDETPRIDDAATTARGAAAERDAAAFADMVRRFQDDLARVSFVVSGDVERAAIAAQGAWSQAWKDRRTPRIGERVRPWLMGLAAKEAKWLTDAGSQARADGTRGDAGIVPATSAAATSAYRSDELDLANTFAAMDSHDRQIVALRYVGGLSSDDIGRELGMPGNAVQARVARILKQLLEAVRNLEVKGDSVEVYERALAQRIRGFASRAVVPLDPDGIARAAIAQAAAEVSVADRLADRLDMLWERVRSARWIRLAIASGVVLALVAVVLLIGGGGGAPISTPTPFATNGAGLCDPGDLRIRVTAWSPDGADRVAAVEMTHIGGVACLIDNQPEPWLVEAPQEPLLIGSDLTGAQVPIEPGDVLRTSVRVRNYCGPEPRAPVTIAFRRGNTVMVAEALTTTDLSGVPPCGGFASSPNDVQMSRWGR